MCIQPQKCKHARQKMSGGCESEFVGECINQEAKEEVLKEYFFINFE